MNYDIYSLCEMAAEVVGQLDDVRRDEYRELTDHDLEMLRRHLYDAKKILEG